MPLVVTLPEHRSPEVEAEYRRLVISHWDFAEAVQFLNHLLAMGEFALDEHSDKLDQRRAWTISALIAYCRPFMVSQGGPLTAPKISVADVEGLTDDQRSLHANMMTRRHNIFAHSAAEMAALTYDRTHPNGPVPLITDRRVAFSLEQAQRFRDLAFHAQRWASGRAARISGVPVMGSARGAPGDG